MPVFPSISPKNRPICFLVFLLASPTQPAYADVNGDQDETFYEMLVKDSFKAFRGKYGRYPKNWSEIGEQYSCSGYYVQERKNFPKPDEAIIWKPSYCQLSYKLVFSGRSSFRVVALAKGHVVSVYENFKAAYFKTPYHDHAPIHDDVE